MPLPPGPRQTALRQTWRWVRDPIGFLDELSARFGPGVPFTMSRAGGKQFVFVSDPEHVKQILLDADTFLAGRAQARLKDFAGAHTLFALDGQAHKRHRRLMMPPFVGERMRAYGDLMRDTTVQEMARWPRGASFRIDESMRRIALEVIFRAVFGVTDVERIDRLETLLTHMTGLGPALMAYMPFLQIDLGRRSPYGRFKRVRAEFDSILYGSIREARANSDQRDDILARLIREGEKNEDPLDDEELRDELLTLLIAGHETTASTLAWAFQWILGLPEVHARVVDEVREVVGDQPVDPADVASLPYVEACLTEALRLHPPAMSLSRYVSKPSTVAGYDLPAGTYVNPSPYLTQRLEHLYPNPERFQPERFFEQKRPSPFAFYPFGGGRRLCVGAPFAMYQMVIVTATIFSRHRLRLVQPPTRLAQRKAVIVVPRGGVPVTQEPIAV